MAVKKEPQPGTVRGEIKYRGSSVEFKSRMARRGGRDPLDLSTEQEAVLWLLVILFICGTVAIVAWGLTHMPR